MHEQNKMIEYNNISLFPVLCVHEWTPEDVAQWLEGLGLGEYKDAFIRNDIQGPELLHLERRDLKVRCTVQGNVYRAITQAENGSSGQSLSHFL
jgi:hypothetical protein